MIPPIPICHVITRLLLSVAVLMCVLGLAEGNAFARDVRGPTAVPAHHEAQVHSYYAPAPAPAAGAASAHAPSAPADGRPGHGDSDGAHVVDCMVPMGALSILAVPAVVGRVVLQAAPESRLRSAMIAARCLRPPDRVTLCVQRV